ncbi:MAG TPA: hypothetical protein P5346_07180 [Spirochaetota bacterium]|nr:hypothetical protein [Spirochaetota bacterium]
MPNIQSMNQQKSPAEITELLNAPDKETRALGYEYFLGRTHWLEGSTPDDLKRLACMLLFLDPEKVLANPPAHLSPERLWASQTSLEKDKMTMVEAAHRYVTETGGLLPPVIVWDFFKNRLTRFVVHDGHHRCQFCHLMQLPVTAVVLEPLGNYEEAEIKMSEAFRIKTRVVSLPVI